MILGTFAENGPNRCCSLDVTRYSFENFESLLSDKFSILRKENTIHITPFNTEQSFNFIEAVKKMNEEFNNILRKRRSSFSCTI